jgi:hypothetical protein
LTTTHSTITDPNIHEPKGAASADANTVYRADGAGSGNWDAPLELIERRTLSGLTAEEFTGLSAYRNLYIIAEGYTLGASASYLLVQVGTSGAYRTSGYINMSNNDVSTTENGTTAGLILGRNSSNLHGCGQIEVWNFNDASHPTSGKSDNLETTTNPISSTISSANPWSNMSFYATVEAHEKFKIVTDNAATISDGFITVYGMV